MNLTPQEQSALITDLAEWFREVYADQVVEYYSALPEKGEQFLADLRGELIQTARLRIQNDCRELFGTALYPTLTEPQRIAFIGNLQQYSTASVIKNYSAKYPELDLQNPPESVQEWAQETIRLWYNTFFFLSTERFLKYRLFLESFMKDKMEEGYYQELLEKAEQAYSLVTEHFVQTNFNFSLLSSDQQKVISDFLDRIPFFPPSHRENLITDDSGEQLFYELRALAYVVQFIVDKFTAFAVDNQVCTLFLQDKLRLDAEFEAIKELADAAVPVDETSAEVKFANRLLDLLTLINIQNGTAHSTLVPYFNSLNREQKVMVREIMQTFINGSSTLKALLDPIDIDYFLAQLATKSAPQRIEFINNLSESNYEPDLQAYVKPLFTLLSQIY